MSKKHSNSFKFDSLSRIYLEISFNSNQCLKSLEIPDVLIWPCVISVHTTYKQYLFFV